MSISVLDIEPKASGIALATTLYTALLVTGNILPFSTASVAVGWFIKSLKSPVKATLLKLVSDTLVCINAFSVSNSLVTTLLANGALLVLSNLVSHSSSFGLFSKSS